MRQITLSMAEFVNENFTLENIVIAFQDEFGIRTVGEATAIVQHIEHTIDSGIPLDCYPDE